MTRNITVSVHTVEVSYVDCVLPDGRRVQLSADGHISVWLSTGSSNQYNLTLPTFEEIAQRCDQNNDDMGNAGTVPVCHRH